MDQQYELPADDQESPSPGHSAEPTEGVRIIGADEAAEAMERGDVIPRRGDRPRYGDRPPPPPPVGPRPTLRFPLDAGADPTRIERPPVQSAPDPDSSPVDQPPWTESPTGEMASVVTGDVAPRAEESVDDLDAWSSFASSSPRWRDADDSWAADQTEFVAALAHDDESRAGTFGDAGGPPVTAPVTGGATAGGSASAKLPWASVPDADDFHDAHNLQETGVLQATSSPEDEQAEQAWDADQEAGGVPVTGSGRGEGIYDDEDPDPVDDPADHPRDEAYEKPGASAVRAARRRARKANRQDGGGASGAGSGGGRDLGTAVVVGVLIVAVFAGLLAIGPGWAMILVTLVIFLAAGELFDALRRAGYDTATLFGLAGCTAFPLAVYWRGVAAFPVITVLALAGCLIWFLAGAAGPEPRVIQGVGATLLGIVWVGGFGSFAAAMLRAADGRALLVTAALATVSYDVGGFFIGRNAGQRRLSEASPNKTIEGLLGGMIVCVVVVVIAVGAIKLGPWDGFGPALALGLAAAVAAPLGDLCQSLVKRDLGVKDMGTILPGHGGIFDRFDSLLFVLPTIYYLVSFVGHRI